MFDAPPIPEESVVSAVAPGLNVVSAVAPGLNEQMYEAVTG
jgi:hypothetical protein